MISISVIITLIFCGLFIIALPVILGYIVQRKYGKISLPIIAGVLSFLVMQVFIRLPILQAISAKQWYKNIPQIWTFILLATSAALFETAGRYLSAKFIIRKNFNFSSGLAHGIGHGGTEAIMLVGLNFVIYGIIAILLNSGIMSGVLTTPSINTLKDTLENTAYYQYFWGTFERISTIIIQIGLSVLVIYGLRINKPIYILYVFLYHSLVDFSTIYVMNLTGSILITEAMIFVYGLIMIFIILRVKKAYSKLEENQEILLR